MNYSMGLFVLCFGTDRSWPDVAHHTIILGERWKSLLDEIFDGDQVPDDPSLYLHRPAATDSSLQPPGHDGFYVLAPVPNLRAGIDWDRAAPLLRERVIQLLEQRCLPGLTGHIVTERMMTPADFQQDYLSRHGAGFSVAPTLLQSAWFRFHNKGPVPGLYLVGAGTHPGAGVPGVLTSAKVVENLFQGWSRFDDGGHERAVALRTHLQPCRQAAADETLADAAELYAFCRAVDDLADETLDPAAAHRDLWVFRAAMVTHNSSIPWQRGCWPCMTVIASISAAITLIDTVSQDLQPVRIADRDRIT